MVKLSESLQKNKGIRRSNSVDIKRNEFEYDLVVFLSPLLILDVATDGEEAADGDGKNAEDLCKASSKLVEHGSDKPFLRCPHKQCGYKLDSMSDVNTHLFMSHVDTTAVMFCEIF